MMAMSKGKWVVEGPSVLEGPTPQDSKKDTLYPLGYTPHHVQMSHGAYILVMSSVGGYLMCVEYTKFILIFSSLF